MPGDETSEGTECELLQKEWGKSGHLLKGQHRIKTESHTVLHFTLRACLNDNLPRRWIGRASGEDNVMLKWSPRSPDLTSCDFFLWGYVKILVYVPPLPANVNELKQRITIALETVTQNMLHRFWEELDYRLDVCRVTDNEYIEHL